MTAELNPRSLSLVGQTADCRSRSGSTAMGSEAQLVGALMPSACARCDREQLSIPVGSGSQRSPRHCAEARLWCDPPFRLMPTILVRSWFPPRREGHLGLSAGAERLGQTGLEGMSGARSRDWIANAFDDRDVGRFRILQQLTVVQPCGTGRSGHRVR
jgi:hypothetical protein